MRPGPPYCDCEVKQQTRSNTKQRFRNTKTFLKKSLSRTEGLIFSATRQGACVLHKSSLSRPNSKELTVQYTDLNINKITSALHRPMPELCYDFQGIILCSIEGQRLFYLGLQFILSVKLPESSTVIPVPSVRSRLCSGAVSAVDKPSCVYVMSIITETLPLNQVLVLFSLASVKIHLSSINFSALASCGCLVAWCTILAARQVKTIHNIKRNAESVKLKENEPFLIF